MDFYQTIEKRRTIRDFEKGTIPTDIIERIIGAGLKAPTNDHMRDWHYILSYALLYWDWKTKRGCCAGQTKECSNRRTNSLGYMVILPCIPMPLLSMTNIEINMNKTGI